MMALLNLQVEVIWYLVALGCDLDILPMSWKEFSMESLASQLTKKEDSEWGNRIQLLTCRNN